MKLKTNKLRTFADVAKPLQALIEKAKSRPASQARDNTIMLLEKQLDDLFAKQEAMKEAENPQPQMPMEQPMQGMEQPQTPMQPEGLPMEQPEMAYGGYLHKYFVGGRKDIFGNPIQEEVVPQQVPQSMDFVRNQNNQSFAQPFLFNTPGSNVVRENPVMNTLTTKGIQPLSVNSFNATPVSLTTKPTLTTPYVPNTAKRGINPFPVSSFTQPKAVPLTTKPVLTPSSGPKPEPTKQGFKRWGEVGALASGMASTFRQNRNINNVDRPDVLNNVYLSAGAAPDKVDYSAELNALNADAAAAKEGLRLSGGNTSAMLGNLGAIRAQQLQKRGQVMQGQENTNTGLINEYKARQAEAAMKSQLTNAGIAQENMANEFGYNQWLAKQRNAAIANETQLTNDVFNNMTTRQNQLDAAGIMANANVSTVNRDAIKGNKPLADYMLAQGQITKQEYDRAMAGVKAMGGMKYADGGSVFKQKLDSVLKDKTVDRAAQMDAEYASYLNKEGQPTQNTFKSKITGLDYKVLPRGEKDLYAAQLWKETLGTAPTKSQKEATKKALEGKPTSSTKAKEVASFSTQPSVNPAVNPAVKDTGYINSRIKDGKFNSPATNMDDMINDHLKFQTEMQKPKADQRYDLSKGVSEWKSNVPNQPNVQANQSGPWPQQPWQNPNREVVIKGDRINKPAPTNVEKLKLKTKAQQPSGPWPQKAWANPNREVVVNADRIRKNVNAPKTAIQNMSSDNTDVVPTELAQVKKKPSFNPNAFGLAQNNAVSPDYVGRGKEAISRFKSEVKDLKDKAKMDVTAGTRMVTKTAADVGGEGFKQALPTSLRSLSKDIVNNNFGTNFKITEKDFTKTEKEEIKRLVDKKLKENKTKGASKSINSYNDYEDDDLNSSQWSDNKNIRNTLGEFNPVQDGDTLRIKDTYNFNEKDNNKVVKTYGKWVSHWKEKGYSSALAYVRATGSRWGSAGSKTGDDTKGTKVDIKLYNPKRKKA
jgi:hypothetical protein